MPPPPEARHYCYVNGYSHHPGKHVQSCSPAGQFIPCGAVKTDTGPGQAGAGALLQYAQDLRSKGGAAAGEP